VLPGPLFGEAVKTYRLARANDEKSELVMSVVVDRLTGLIWLLTLGVVALMLVPEFEGRRIAWVAAGLLLAGADFLLRLMLRPRRQDALLQIAGKFASPRRGSPALQRRLEPVWAALFAYREAIGAIAMAVLQSCAFQGLVTVSGVFVARALGIDLPLLDFFLIMIVVSVVQLLPVTVG
jgi:hypothetical protein